MEGEYYNKQYLGIGLSDINNKNINSNKGKETFLNPLISKRNSGERFCKPFKIFNSQSQRDIYNNKYNDLKTEIPYNNGVNYNNTQVIPKDSLNNQNNNNKYINYINYNNNSLNNYSNYSNFLSKIPQTKKATPYYADLNQSIKEQNNNNTELNTEINDDYFVRKIYGKKKVDGYFYKGNYSKPIFEMQFNKDLCNEIDHKDKLRRREIERHFMKENIDLFFKNKMFYNKYSTSVGRALIPEIAKSSVNNQITDYYNTNEINREKPNENKQSNQSMQYGLANSVRLMNSPTCFSNNALSNLNANPILISDHVSNDNHLKKLHQNIKYQESIINKKLFENENTNKERNQNHQHLNQYNQNSSSNNIIANIKNESNQESQNNNIINRDYNYNSKNQVTQGNWNLKSQSTNFNENNASNYYKDSPNSIKNRKSNHINYNNQPNEANVNQVNYNFFRSLNSKNQNGNISSTPLLHLNNNFSLPLIDKSAFNRIYPISSQTPSLIVNSMKNPNEYYENNNYGFIYR